MEIRGSLALAILILVQVTCAVFFLWDVIDDASTFAGLISDPHLIVELLATVVLLIGIAVEWQYLTLLLRRQARAERALNVAAGDLHDLMEQYFRDWGLTPSEADVAMFALKGSSIAEIAELRGSKDGTIKAHLNGIYRKAGVSGRAQLVSLLIEDLMAAPLGGASQPA